MGDGLKRARAAARAFEKYADASRMFGITIIGEN